MRAIMGAAALSTEVPFGLPARDGLNMTRSPPTKNSAARTRRAAIQAICWRRRRRRTWRAIKRVTGEGAAGLEIGAAWGPVSAEAGPAASCAGSPPAAVDEEPGSE